MNKNTKIYRVNDNEIRIFERIIASARKECTERSQIMRLEKNKY